MRNCPFGTVRIRSRTSDGSEKDRFNLIKYSAQPTLLKSHRQLAQRVGYSTKQPRHCIFIYIFIFIYKVRTGGGQNCVLYVSHPLSVNEPLGLLNVAHMGQTKVRE